MLKLLLVICVAAFVNGCLTENPCSNVKAQLDDLFNLMEKEYNNNLKPYYSSIAPHTHNPFNNTDYLHAIKGNDYKCYTMFETLNFLIGDVYTRATTNEHVRLSLAKLAMSSAQGAMLMNLCKSELECGPPPFDTKVLYQDREQHGADDVMASLDSAFSNFRFSHQLENTVV